MRVPLVTVVIPTLTAGPKLRECLRGLERQDMDDWEAIIVDNSGAGAARQTVPDCPGRVRILETGSNIGFGGAVNRAVHESGAPFLAVLNDDAEPRTSWLCEMLNAIEGAPRAGMCASRVLLTGKGLLDSAGMLICADGSSKQRGHLAPPDTFSNAGETLFPSGSAALYRREMLDEIGGFDELFFLYCEDADLGLRALRAGWRCVYAPAAIVDHQYSLTAGGASGLKAFYVERNRLFVLVKCFPASMLAAAPFVTLARYFWSFAAYWNGSGRAGAYRNEGGGVLTLAWMALRAHGAALRRLPDLLRQRRRIEQTSRITTGEFKRLLAAHSIAAREVARL